jgi:tetratricopeptide (TPR) repeat protein
MSVPARASSPTLVGRDDELAVLRGLLGDVLAGGSGCAVVAGEAGVGKSRLVHELVSAADAATVLVGGCVGVGRDVLPYAPFTEILDELTARQGAPTVRALGGTTADELGRLCPALADGSTSEVTRASGSRLFAALRCLIGGLAQREPLLLVVEDLHWSDAGTRDLLGLLAHRLPPRVLLVLTVRTDEADEPRALRSFLAQLGRVPAHRLELPRLTREQQARQLAGILGVPPSRDRLTDVFDRAEGNPFFAEELVALGGAGPVPATVRDLLQARLDTLPAATRRAVRAAAAAGRRVEHGLLAGVLDLTGTAVDEALRPAVQRHVLVADPAGYAFRHALLHETVADTLLPGERARLHRRFAELLTGFPELAGGQQGLAGRVARHWLAAGDLARGRRASYEAALEAVRTLAFAEALAHYERVLSLSPDAAGDELPAPRYRVLWDAAEVAHLSGAASRAAELARAAIEAVDPEQRHHHAYLHERLGRYLWMAAEGRAALAAYRRAVDLVPTEPPSCWQAAIVSGYAQVLMLSGRHTEARAEAERAIDLARQVGARSTEGHARNNLGCSLGHLGDVDAGVEQLRTAARIAEEEFDDVDDIARALVNLHSLLYDAGRFAEALDVARRGVAVVDQLGLRRRKGTWCRCDAIDALLVLGRYGDAEALVAEAVAAEPEGIDVVRLLAVRGRLALRQGRLDAAPELLGRARERGARIIDGHLVLPLHRDLAETRQRLGDPAGAVAIADELLAGAWGDGDGGYLVSALAVACGAAADAAQAARTERRPDAAASWADVAARLARAAEERAGGAPLLPPAEVALATARAEADRAAGSPDASAWAEIAERLLEMEDRYQAGWALLREAEAHLSARRRARGADAVAGAGALADALGARCLAEAAASLARRTGTDLQAARPRRRATGSASAPGSATSSGCWCAAAPTARSGVSSTSATGPWSGTSRACSPSSTRGPAPRSRRSPTGTASSRSTDRWAGSRRRRARRGPAGSPRGGGGAAGGGRSASTPASSACCARSRSGTSCGSRRRTRCARAAPAPTRRRRRPRRGARRATGLGPRAAPGSPAPPSRPGPRASREPQVATAAAGGPHRREELRGGEAGAEHDRVDRPLGTVGGDDRARPHLDDPVDHHVHLRQLQGLVPVIGQQDALAAQRVGGRGRRAQRRVRGHPPEVAAVTGAVREQQPWIGVEAERAELVGEVGALPEQPQQARHTRERPLGPFAVRAVGLGQHVGGRALDDGEVRGPRRDGRHELDGAGAGAHDGDPLAGEFVVVVPACGVEEGALEPVQTGEDGGPRPAQLPGGRDQHVGLVLAAARQGESPGAGVVVEGRGEHLGAKRMCRSTSESRATSRRYWWISAWGRTAATSRPSARTRGSTGARARRRRPPDRCSPARPRRRRCSSRTARGRRCRPASAARRRRARRSRSR